MKLLLPWLALVLLTLAAAPRSAPPESLNPRTYGAVCDGVVDDTASMQAAVNVWKLGKPAVLELPSGTCRITGTLDFGKVDGSAVFGTIRGSGPQTSTILYDNPNGTALRFSTFKYGRLEGFGVQHAQAPGSATGILFTHSAFGIGTNGVTVSDVTVSRFHVGVQLGDINTGAAAAEMLFDGLNVYDSDTCISALAFNTLDLVFVKLNMAGCGIGVAAEQAEQLNFYGGAGSNNGVTFKFGSAGSFVIDGWREEGNRGPWWLASGCCDAATQVTVRNTRVLGSLGAQPVAVYSSGWAFHQIENSMLAGEVQVRVDGGGLRMTNTGVWAPWSSAAWRFKDPSAATGVGTHVMARGNWKPASRHDSAVVSWWPDTPDNFYTLQGMPSVGPP